MQHVVVAQNECNIMDHNDIYVFGGVGLLHSCRSKAKTWTLSALTGYCKSPADPPPLLHRKWMSIFFFFTDDIHFFTNKGLILHPHHAKKSFLCTRLCKFDLWLRNQHTVTTSRVFRLWDAGRSNPYYLPPPTFVLLAWCRSTLLMSRFARNYSY